MASILQTERQREVSEASSTSNASCADVVLRHYPYPYDAMLAICSDLDETPDGAVYYDIARFLNTTDDTPMGPGVGLEVGNSIYFDMPAGQFSYWGTDESGREMVRDMIQSGHIDCLHSYGDFAKSRDDAKRAIEELDRQGCKLEVWVDHSKAPSNFGPDIMVGSGDVVGSPVYHADLTTAYGIRYVWRGRTTGVTGQNVPIGVASLSHMLEPAHPLGSARTLAKEAVKILLGGCGSHRWKMYADNRVCRVNRLRDGRAVWEFLRSNPYWAGSGRGDTADGVSDVLTLRMLNRLVKSGGICVLYTHLGKVTDRLRPFGEKARASFRRLSAMCNDGAILVATTHRLLRYLTTRDSLQFGSERKGDRLTIAIEGVKDPVSGIRQPSRDDLDGLTFRCRRTDRISLTIKGHRDVEFDVQHVGDSSYVSISWRRLSFPSGDWNRARTGDGARLR